MVRLYSENTRIDGKVVIITGANAGIGYETTLELAKRGAKIYMACRDFERCEKARLEIIKQSDNQNIFNRTLDLASLKSIREFVKQYVTQKNRFYFLRLIFYFYFRFLEEETRLDILINNAGLMKTKRELTEDGFEAVLGVNHMGPFLLTNLLLERLKESAPSRILLVSSDLHKIGHIKRDDLNSEKSFCELSSYSQSKLANNLFVRELSKRLHGTGVTVNSIHPGIVGTEFLRDHPCLKPMKFFSKTPLEGAQTSIFCAIDPSIENVTGKYFADMRVACEANRAKDDEVAEWLWKTSEEWTQAGLL